MGTFFKTVKNAIKHWYIPLLTGVLFIFLGIYTLTSPQESYLALSVLFSLTFIASGVSEIYFAISNREALDNWGWILFFGIISLMIGILMIANPALSMITMPFYVGFLVLFRSIAGISFALDLKSYGVLDWGNLMIAAILGLLFSFILIWNPLFAGISIVIWTGLSLIFAGGYAIFLSFKLKKLKDSPERISKDLKEKWDKLNEEINQELQKK